MSEFWGVSDLAILHEMWREERRVDMRNEPGPRVDKRIADVVAELYQMAGTLDAKANRLEIAFFGPERVACEKVYDGPQEQPCILRSLTETLSKLDAVSEILERLVISSEQ